MDISSTKQSMVSLLTHYQQLVISQLAEYDLVGEYLNKPMEENVRLLCQMRTIIFLIKTAELSKDNNIRIAEQLYVKTETNYLKTDKWLQQLNNNQEANLYSYAFVILAQSYLYKVTNNPLYAIALAETFSLVEHKFQDLAIFKPLSESDCLEQNSAMHLFEALTFAYYQADAVYMQPAILRLEQLIAERFWQKDKQLLAEKVMLSGQVLSYEAGHWFEWISLIWRVSQQGGESFTNSNKLYATALTHTRFSEQGLVLNEMDAQFHPLDTQQIRIWPNLEYLRAKTFIEQQIPVEELNTFIELFFDQRGLPREYLTKELVQTVKSTTGYHIAESFVDILNINEKL
ncbi:AGE family epimerase/isomerase [Entomomonas sp. E2T0]|uniref:AGE family epimerase/isomerase n=1 Tax=Entomomonas sp. E2T0 TaxID=2930213 RepID=UPI00222811E1|nr:AGE family epimerase/isomerase [Entomomonas sp. E2T0]UYZ84206.1 AGE family epimerase/isomerase [Entomomonas sp. E2T0]